jgi:hypothetical protein
VIYKNYRYNPSMRFRKSIKIAPGVKVNLSKSGISGTFGVKGASVNVGKNGAYLNTGIPGTGIYDRQKIGGAAPGADQAGTTENEGIFIENPTPEQTNALGRVFGIVLLVIGAVSLLIMLWLGFNVIGIIFMSICFLIGLLCVIPTPKIPDKNQPIETGEPPAENQ